MREDATDWQWFDKISAAFGPQGDTPRLFARVFQTPDGQKVIEHLKNVTLCRALGPEASDASLRHLEGQRQFVSHILSLIERGRQFS